MDEKIMGLTPHEHIEYLEREVERLRALIDDILETFDDAAEIIFDLNKKEIRKWIWGVERVKCCFCGETIMDDDFITNSYCCEKQHEKQVGWQP